MNKILCVTNVLVGLLALSLQIAALSIYTEWDPDKAGAGIWGGIYLVIFGVLLMMKKLKTSGAVTGMAVVAVLIGITLIGLYSWSIDSYQEAISNCGWVPAAKICDRAAIDSLMIISGILALIVNGIIATKASSFVP
ncbi:uncharacterized protein LOC130698110 [Daphnia carinata]|uniref:uncharacterized protein LOC130698110 n=1 Tax=Daphnia carinata TaxID=120202 RepID=UPI00257B4EAF|nr:uncharacterized protein LOC130698110 [Daphnia carinata]